jgi:hypothetical protein
MRVRAVILVEQPDLSAAVDDGDGNPETTLAAMLDRGIRHELCGGERQFTVA